MIGKLIYDAIKGICGSTKTAPLVVAQKVNPPYAAYEVRVKPTHTMDRTTHEFTATVQVTVVSKTHNDAESKAWQVKEALEGLRQSDASVSLENVEFTDLAPQYLPNSDHFAYTILFTAYFEKP